MRWLMVRAVIERVPNYYSVGDGATSAGRERREKPGLVLGRRARTWSEERGGALSGRVGQGRADG